MKKPFSRTGLIALTSLLALVLLPAIHANPASAVQPLADKKAPALPVSVTFDKGTPGENGGPYTAKVKNTSQAALKVSGTIVWSVTSHNRGRTIDLPARTIEAGGTWSISDLSVEDRLTLTAEGYEKVEVTVAPSKAAK